VLLFIDDWAWNGSPVPMKSTNIAATHADEHQQLYNEMTSYFEQVGARIPKLNPDYDTEVYKKAKEDGKREPVVGFIMCGIIVSHAIHIAEKVSPVSPQV
jgi:hypothetical protein